MQETELLIENLRDFILREVEPLAEKIDREDWYPRDLVRKMGELGYLDPMGNGLSLYQTCLILEELAKVSGSVALIQDAQGELVTEPIRKFSNNDVVDELSSGKIIGGFGLSEPCCGSDAKSIKTKAEKDGGGWRITGEKMWTTQGLYADVFLIIAKADEGLSAFLVRKSDCLKTEKIEVMGNRGTGTAHLFLEGCWTDQKIGNLGKGWEVAKYALTIGRVAISAISIGLAEGSIQEALDWARQREVMSQLLINYQGIRWYIADVMSKLLAVKSLLKDASVTLSDLSVSSLKLFSSNVSQEAVDVALQIMGGMGYAKGTKTERAYRDVRLTRIGEGTDEVQKNIIGKYLKENHRSTQFF
ncbi:MULTISPECIES: acyl-CoA dehydrogenase family protein [Acidianus]|uniref:Acyl-CoA dehydrogenase n=1 Tax=Candidatus Acidianus copahuensis TaxID=1160895 RepID=A0A031LIN8_9CREN|nr:MULTISPECIES: acyl-CoA dehydrogenase family protein [Acidianus]EZQ02002.1 acyl-CoA dehydrogenase [Candidatus Acidianus copahuensis]NON63565.1 acyl-CoA/acyl-ACP dehydrogenase [Acidianus sp. RZ1]